MKLDKSHLDQFENISPPMKHALTLPVVGLADGDVCVYVCATPFNDVADEQDVLDVAMALRLVDKETYDALCWAADKLMEVQGAHGHVIDLLRALARGNS